MTSIDKFRSPQKSLNLNILISEYVSSTYDTLFMSPEEPGDGGDEDASNDLIFINFFS